MMSNDSPTTNPSIFVRLKATDAKPREFAWNEFHARYAPVIAAFAKRLGGKPQDVDDAVQDVLTGFFAKAPTFAYDPAKGRFRGYLKVCTYHALKKRLGKQARVQGKPLDTVPEDSIAIEQIWNDAWEQEKLRRALAEVKAELGDSKTAQAFELYVVRDQPVQEVAKALDMHVNSVYRAKEQITEMLQKKMMAKDEDD
jgi:RNA polymerase sigma factor (sigma-70 family)